MLWALTPAPTIRAAWALAIVPAVPFVISLLCLLACRVETACPFKVVKEQLAADLTMLREVSSPERSPS